LKMTFAANYSIDNRFQIFKLTHFQINNHDRQRISKFSN
jgi:hypothetical protein